MVARIGKGRIPGHGRCWLDVMGMLIVRMLIVICGILVVKLRGRIVDTGNIRRLGFMEGKTRDVHLVGKEGQRNINL